MRRYNVVLGILFILPIINFTLAAPVLVQEERHAFVDEVHRPDDAEITVLGKRVIDPLDSMWNKYFEKLWGKPEVSSATHAPSSLAPSAPSHGSTNVIQAPAPNSGLSTANPDHRLVEMTSPSSALSPIPEGEETVHAGSDGHLHAPPPSPSSSEVGLNHEITEVHSPQSNPNPKPILSTIPSNAKLSTTSGANWKHWLNPLNLMRPPNPGAALSKPSKSMPSKDSMYWGYWGDVVVDNKRPSKIWNLVAENMKKPPTKASVPGPSIPGPPITGTGSIKLPQKAGPLTIGSPKMPGAALSKPSKSMPSKDSMYRGHWGGVEVDSKRPSNVWKLFAENLKKPPAKASVPGPSIPGPSIPGPSITGTGSIKLPQNAGPLTIGSPRIPPSDIAPQSSSTDLPAADSQPLDPQAALYAAKGKAKVLPRISGTSGDVENTDQRELRPVGRSLDRGEPTSKHTF